MARIKAVISERRYAYKQALRLRRLLRRNPALYEAVETREAAGADSMLEEGDEESLAAGNSKTP